LSRVIHFEIPADDAGRAVDFYKKVFGWKIEKWDGPANYWLITTGEEKEPGIDGAITEKSENVQATTNTISVQSFDEAAERITREGGKIIIPKTIVPGVGYMAYCKDTEGNVFGIMQMDSHAK
jgi:predicted enzyme related to lactoylglutathione lyase